MALITIMAMALLVYALAEERLREALAALKQGLPDQLGRMTNRPTLRWISSFSKTSTGSPINVILPA